MDVKWENGTLLIEEQERYQRCIRDYIRRLTMTECTYLGMKEEED